MNIEEIESILKEEYKELGSIIIQALRSQEIRYVDSVDINDKGKINIAFRTMLGNTPVKNNISICRKENGDTIIDNDSMYTDGDNNVYVSFYERVYDKNLIETTIKSYQDIVPMIQKDVRLDNLSILSFNPHLEEIKSYYKLPPIYNCAKYECAERQPSNPTIAHIYTADNIRFDKPANIESGMIACWDEEHPTMMRVNYSGSLAFYEKFNPRKGKMEPVDPNNTSEDVQRIYEERMKTAMDNLEKTNPELASLFKNEITKSY